LTADDKLSGNGPLAGIHLLEVGGIGSIPHFGMMCADLGASIIRVDRPGPAELDGLVPPAVARGRQTIELDLKVDGAVEVLLRLAASADVLIEGYRPGVAERLGFGPENCLERYPSLVYARMTGWGAFGPYAASAGHDLNYLALSGVLGSLGPAGGTPTVPLPLVADFGGGSMLLLASVLAALIERERSGCGQVVDVAMVDGVIGLMAYNYADAALGKWGRPRGENAWDGGAHFYNVYETKDARYVAVAAGEPKFYRSLLDRLGLDDGLAATQYDETEWPTMKARLARIFATKTREEWEEHFAAVDACVTPVLTMEEAPHHPHHRERGTFQIVDGQVQPNSPYRFSRTPATVASLAAARLDTTAVLARAGYSPSEIDLLRNQRIITAD
jgi:alpha-methylacyl-CoA racemase